MKEPRTLLLLHEAISDEYSWRISELSNFRNSISTIKGRAQEGMIRAGITLLYAHWEGFIKNICDYYYQFVGYQHLRVEQLNNAFVGISLRSELELLINSKKLEQHTKIISILFDEKQKKAHFSSNSPIKTSNLNYSIFTDICTLLGISVLIFEQRYRISFNRSIQYTIDEDLVKRRNTIAHGNFLTVDIKEFNTLYHIVVNGFLYNFKEIVMDSAQSAMYIRNSSL